MADKSSEIAADVAINKRQAATTTSEKRKKKRKRFRESKKKVPRDEQTPRNPFVEVTKENAQFEEYYKTLGIVPAGEWDQFTACLKEPLPAAFRLTGCRSSAVSLLRVLESKYFKEILLIEVEGERVSPPRPLSWYPDQLAWHVDLTRKFIRKSPLMSSFHLFLVNQTELGNISRQEAVSMIPPLLLDVKPHHKVLDMCAAPGSKTAQIIESLHAEDSEDNPVPSGVVVANDADNKRCYMLVHQAKRLNSPCVLITNHDATVMPNLYYHNSKDERCPLVYDRILCDVPCSGDGTLRKNVTIWRSWAPNKALGLHKLQLSILLRGLELLSSGGRLVYSTCSLNPVENEAVVAAALNCCKGSVELVDISGALPSLKTVPGMTSWKVMTSNGAWFQEHKEVPKNLKDLLPPSVFPPTTADQAAALGLSRCMRLLPHHEDSGGFFVAVLVKKDVLPWRGKKKKREEESKTRGEPSGTRRCPVEVSGEGTQVTLESEPDRTGLTGKLEGGRESSVSKSEQGKQDLPPSASNSEQESTTQFPPEQTDSVSCSPPVPDPPMPVVPGPPSKGTEEASEQNPLDRLRMFTNTKRNRGYKEDPFVFVEEGNALWSQIKNFYNLSEDFPTCQMLTRTLTGKKRNFYFSSGLVRELTIRNSNSVKVINIGTKTLSRCSHKNAQCDFRLVQEGISSFLPYVRRQRVSVPRADMVALLRDLNPLFASLTEETAKSFESMDFGPCVVVYRPASGEDDSLATDRVALSTWRAAVSARLFVSEKERVHLLTILGEAAPQDVRSAPKQGPPREGGDHMEVMLPPEVELEGEGMPEEMPSLLVEDNDGGGVDGLGDEHLESEPELLESESEAEHLSKAEQVEP